MAGRKRSLFELEDDSVATDSTRESIEEEEYEYEVEKILFEQLEQQTGEMKYLVKWVGYPLHRATFESADMFMSDEILEQWEHQKRLVEQGDVKRFDIQEYVDAYSLHEEKRARRREKREQKREARREQRRKDALTAFQSTDNTDEQENDDDDDDDDDDMSEVAAPMASRRSSTKSCSNAHGGPPSSKKKSLPPKPRKGLARPVPKTKHPTVSSSDETSDDGGDADASESSSDADSLLEEIRGRAKLSTAAPSSPKTTKATLVKSSTTSDRAMMKSPKATAASTSKPANHIRANTEAVAKAGVKGVAHTGRRTSVPSVMANWEADKKKRQSSGIIRRPSTDASNPLFQTLGIQYNFQKSRRNEPAPDINALIMINPKTGKPEPAKARTQSVAPLPGIPSEYRRTPPRPQRVRSISPPPNSDAIQRNPGEKAASNPPPEQEQINTIQGAGKKFVCEFWDRGECRHTEETCQFAHHYIDQSRPPQHYSKGQHDSKSVTCQFWHSGHCRKSEDQCSFAHHDTGIYAPSLKKAGSRITCWFWKHGGCKKPASQCEFAHYDTGIMQPLATKKFTCRFWKNGGCKKSEESCQYAHRDTGLDDSEIPPSRAESAATNAASVHSAVHSTEDMAGRRRSTQPAYLQNDYSHASGPIWSAANVISPTETKSSVDGKTSATATDRSAPGQVNRLTNVIKHGAIEIRPDDATDLWTLKARFETSDLMSFTRLVGPSPCIRVDCSILAADVRVIVFENQDSARKVEVCGDITCEPACSAQADSLAVTCKSHGCGLMATLKDTAFRMIIFPGDDEVWRFAETRGQGNSSPGVTFRFQVFKCHPELHALARTPPKVPTLSSTRVIANLLQQLDALDVKRLLPLNEKRGTERTVFLMIPPEHRHERDIYIKVFGALKVKVYTSETPGAWSYVREHHFRPCTLIIHPEIPLWKVPGLYNFIVQGQANIRIFSMGVHRALAILEDRQPRFECRRLFPHGTVYFITDEVFLYHPRLALQIINQFLEQHKNKPEGGENDRIAARPGVKEWLLGVAERNTVGGDARWISLWNAVCQLCPPEDEDPRDPPNPLPTSNLISVSPDLMPSFQTLLEQQDTDEFAPTDWMVNWFAGWSLGHVTEFRRFIVCHSPKEVTLRRKVVMDENGRMMDSIEPVEADPRRWGKKYQHIGVMPPESCIKRKK